MARRRRTRYPRRGKSTGKLKISSGRKHGKWGGTMHAALYHNRNRRRFGPFPPP